MPTRTIVAQEESKFGLKPEEVLPLIEQIADFSHIRIKGLMTIAPYVDNAEENREIFRELKKLSVDIAAKNINNVTMSVLSMGMTGDYMVAVQEGATFTSIRIGTITAFFAASFSIVSARRSESTEWIIATLSTIYFTLLR